MSMLFTPVEVFYASAESDASLLEQLERHLSMLRHEGQITTWHRRQIGAGNDWQMELDRHLDTASLILLLISPDFLASDYQYGVELQRAVLRHRANETQILPILLRACDWKGAPFDKLQLIPRNGIAITSWHNLDEAFAEVAREIRTALATIRRSSPATSPSAFPKIWQIPYPRNPVFTGREEILEGLRAGFQTEHFTTFSQLQAISGLGGIGKTQIAVEYAYRFHQEYQAVFWVYAESQEALSSSYTILANLLQLPEYQTLEQEHIVQAVKMWLQRHEKWLLIFDSVDDVKLLPAFLPPVWGGHILLTTQAWDMKRLARRVEVRPLSEKQGALFLLRRAG